MAKAKDELIEVTNSAEPVEPTGSTDLGEFTVMHADSSQVRMAHEESVSNLVLRRKSALKGLERGATYMLTATLVEPKPEEGRITVEMDAKDAHTLPNSAEGVKVKK